MFAGHREAYQSGIDTRLRMAIETVLSSDTTFECLTGGMGEFDAKAAAAVRSAKRQHPELDIKLTLVSPYMSNEFNKNKEYYENSFDDIVIPSELADVHYKAAIKKRNEWMVDRSDYLIAYVYRDFGGAADTLRYAKRKNDIQIMNVAE